MRTNEQEETQPWMNPTEWNRMLRNTRISLMNQFVKAKSRIVEDEVARNFHKWSKL